MLLQSLLGVGFEKYPVAVGFEVRTYPPAYHIHYTQEVVCSVVI